jgi:threonine/homoserine efflux transporter RhtA
VLGGGPSGFIFGGVVPLALAAGAVWGAFALARRRHGASVNEALQAAVVLVVVAFVVLTLIGVWFRGEGMALAWPWQ